MRIHEHEAKDLHLPPTVQSQDAERCCREDSSPKSASSGKMSCELGFQKRETVLMAPRQNRLTLPEFENTLRQ